MNSEYNSVKDVLDSAVFHNSDFKDKLSVLGDLKFQIIVISIFFILYIGFLIYLKLTGKMTRYKSNMIKVTDDIYIPEPAGQGQYGTAHFLEKKDLDKKYKYN